MLWSPLVVLESDIRSWSDGAVVYVRRCGDTHRISLLAAEILSLLICNNPASIEMIVTDLRDIMANLADNERFELVSSALISLNQAGLVDVVTEC